ncbi:MAG: hypothetical protein FWF51_05175 [Chitinivibrionia bacterium]|nr:hypothetical protein [Chitinivibrionia bacterium]
MKRLIFILIFVFCAAIFAEEKESQLFWHSLKYQRTYTVFEKESPKFASYTYERRFIYLNSLDLEIFKEDENGRRFGGVFDFGKGNIGVGLHIGRQTLDKTFKFNGGFDCGVWLFSAQAIDESAFGKHGRVKQTMALGGPRIGFLVGRNSIFFDFNAKIYLGVSSTRDMERYNYDFGFLHNFDRGRKKEISAIPSASAGAAFVLSSDKKRSKK